MSLFPLTHDFYVLEGRTISAVGLKELSRWSEPNSLRPLFIGVYRPKIVFSLSPSSMKIIDADRNNLASRTLIAFDDFFAAKIAFDNQCKENRDWYILTVVIGLPILRTCG